jgi:hypothetical protein
VGFGFMASNICVCHIPKQQKKAKKFNLRNFVRRPSNGNLPKCPAGGTYIIGRVGENPKCSIGTSSWPNSHILPEGDKENWWTDFKAAYGILFGLRHFQKP